MTGTHDAMLEQNRAADPASSVWLGANAGSGKTRVLTDRVIRLMLRGTRPERILCLTYTRAAAAEMQNRLFRRLGEWAMLPDTLLTEALGKIGATGDTALTPDALARARRLFATAIETPGGIRIQTIHAFCAGLLRRFPLEAGVAPGFRELDEAEARLLRRQVAEEIAGGPDMHLFDGIALLTGEDMGKFLDRVVSLKDRFPPEVTEADIWSAFGLPEGFRPGDEVAWLDARIDRSFVEAAAEAFAGLGGLMEPPFQALSSVVRTGVTPDTFASLVSAFLTQANVPSKRLPTKAGQERLGNRIADYEHFVDLLAEAVGLQIARATAEATLALYRFAAAYLPLYRARKDALGVLDFDDLIARTDALLSDPGEAAWVLWRLDGGIEHILIDEAQDTSPAQWRVIRLLTQEFTSGEGTREGRTLFTVGDLKQSIYSFQGADLGAYLDQESQYSTLFEGIGTPLSKPALQHSFRSAPAVLRVVDHTFAEGSPGLGARKVTHLDIDPHRPGRVDLWPLVEGDTAASDEPAIAPGWIEAPEKSRRTLARHIARELRRLIDAGTQISVRAPDSSRFETLHEGHVMILLQSRGELFHAIIRACKAEGLSIAGADRMRLAGEIAVRDFAALLSFLDLPEDDLSLAVVLKSPLIGLTEGRLYDLAATRGQGEYLWQALRRRSDDFPEAVAFLNDLRSVADYLRPYELIERALTRHSGRAKILARLGAEAEDGLDQLVATALDHERTEVPSVTGFLLRLLDDVQEVRRTPDAAGKAIRVMTVHAAKGLEAPLVILPDTTDQNPRNDDKVHTLTDGRPYVRAARADATEAQRRADEARARAHAEERQRLLYVAMTRAESWLIVCGATLPKVKAGPESWYRRVEAGLARAGTTASVDHPEIGPILRHAVGRWPGDTRMRGETPVTDPVPPDWLAQPAPPTSPLPRPVLPSDLGGAKVMPGEAEGGAEGDAARAWGTALHRLLEHLPALPPASWAEAAYALSDPGAPDPAALLAEAQSALTALTAALPQDANLLREVEVAAPLDALRGRLVAGKIDLLHLSPDRVLAIDYKSNLIVPQTAKQVPDGLLRQMGAYAAILERLYPGRRIETAILWTRSATLMPLPCDIVRAALQRATIP
jgi:ATP-dependent helicase/nuclease subunit A